MKHMLLILATLCSAPALADSLVPVINNANIDSSGSRYQGNLSVNQAAGDKQQQVNARAIAVGPEANASTQIRQRLNTPTDPAMDARSTIQATPSATAVAHWASTRAPGPTPSKPTP